MTIFVHCARIYCFSRIKVNSEYIGYRNEKMKIILLQFLIFTQASVFEDFTNLFQQLETLISSDSENAEPGQLDYSNVFKDVLENRQQGSNLRSLLELDDYLDSVLIVYSILL